MKSLARKMCALTLVVLLPLGTFPCAAFAEDNSIKPAEALERMRQWGVFDGDDDVLKTYLGDREHLSGLGSALYSSMLNTYDMKRENRAVMEKVLSLKPMLDRLRENGPYVESKDKSVRDKLEAVEKELGRTAAAADGSVESQFVQGVKLEAAKRKLERQIKLREAAGLPDRGGTPFSEKRPASVPAFLYSRALLCRPDGHQTC